MNSFFLGRVIGEGNVDKALSRYVHIDTISFYERKIVGFFNVYFERQSVRVEGRERERERQRIPSRLCVVSTEPN